MRRRALLGLAVAYFTLQALPALAANYTVTIKGMKFSPKTLKVKAGAKITFINRDSVPHTATAADGSFDTGRLGSGQSKSIVILKAGTHNYACQIHPSMKGTVTAK